MHFSSPAWYGFSAHYCHLPLLVFLLSPTATVPGTLLLHTLLLLVLLHLSVAPIRIPPAGPPSRGYHLPTLHSTGHLSLLKTLSELDFPLGDNEVEQS